MNRRKRKRLYEAATSEWKRGLLRRAEGRLLGRPGATPRDPGLSDRYDERNALRVAYNAGWEGEGFGKSDLPLDIWVKVLAEAQRP